MNGLLLVNKPKGVTSHDVVAKVRRAFKMKAVGHAGTLDPLAEGLIVVLLGEATKFSNYIMGQDKHYIAEVQLGIETDTWDAEGEIKTTFDELKNKNLDISKDKINKEVEALCGDLSLQVPVYSAVKIKGKKLYDYARDGKEIETPIRKMKFYKTELLKTYFSKVVIEEKPVEVLSFSVDLKCEKGSYIRSWVYQLGQNLGCGAIMSGLIRHQSGGYNLSKSVSFASLDEKASEFNEDLLKAKVIDLKDCFDGPFYRVFANEARLLKNGQIPHDLNLRMHPQLRECQNSHQSKLVRIFNSDLSELLAILELPPQGRLKIIRAFQS